MQLFASFYLDSYRSTLTLCLNYSHKRVFTIYVKFDCGCKFTHIIKAKK